MRKIAIFTSTRAEYGLLFWLIKAIQSDEEVTLQLIVSGAHLSPQQGETWLEIEEDGFHIDAKVEMLLASDTPVGVIKSMGVAAIGFADTLERLKPDILVVLGDRYETLVIAQAALIMKIPIAHIHGGEVTQGAYDDAIRHAITKMANLHFVAAEAYRQRVIQMGESPQHVFNVGAPGLEQTMKAPRYAFNELAEQMRIPLQQPYFIVTFHPVTLANEPVEQSLMALLAILAEMPDYQILFTYPNVDNGGHRVIQLIEQYQKKYADRAWIVRTLGPKLYSSAMFHAHAVIGNSSSGIIEVPFFKIPTVNIGSRQTGRLAADSVIHAAADYASIDAAVKQAISPSFRELCQTASNPYGDGDVSTRILPLLKTCSLTSVKAFQDIEFDYDNA